MITIILFDLGGVLIDFSHQKMCENIAKLCDIPLEVITSHLFDLKIVEKYEKGLISDEDLYEYFANLSQNSFTVDELMHSFCDIFHPKEEMTHLLYQLKKQNYPLYLLSNTFETHFTYLKNHYDFLSLFDGYTLSYEVGARKPEKEIYDFALSLAKATPEQCFYIDDVAEYVSAAKEYGIDGHHFENIDSLIPALRQRNILI